MTHRGTPVYKTTLDRCSAAGCRLVYAAPTRDLAEAERQYIFDNLVGYVSGDEDPWESGPRDLDDGDPDLFVVRSAEGEAWMVVAATQGSWYETVI